MVILGVMGDLGVVRVLVKRREMFWIEWIILIFVRILIIDSCFSVVW